MSIFVKFLLGSLTVGSVFFSCTPLLRASEDAQPPNAPQLLQELDSLEKQQSSAVAARLLSQANILRPALEGGSTSSKLYQEALEAVESRGRRDTGQTAADWRKKNADFLRSGQLQTAVQLHVRYLLLGLQGAGSPRNGGEWDSAGQSWAYAQELAETLQEKDLTHPPPPVNDLLFKPVSEGVFARWLALEDCLPAGDAWESQPGNLAGILEKNVRPSWRKARNPQIIATWDLQMNFEAAKATATQLTSAADRFNNLDRPKLLFGRARDRHQVGQPNRAIMEVMQLLREYPAHPETAEWSAFVRRALAAAPSSPEANDAGGRDTAKP